MSTLPTNTNQYNLCCRAILYWSWTWLSASSPWGMIPVLQDIFRKAKKLFWQCPCLASVVNTLLGLVFYERTHCDRGNKEKAMLECVRSKSPLVTGIHFTQTQMLLQPSRGKSSTVQRSKSQFLSISTKFSRDKVPNDWTHCVCSRLASPSSTRVVVLLSSTSSFYNSLV